MTYAGIQAEAAHDGPPHGWRRWVCSTNHKDIGTMYLVFALVAGMIGALLSVAMRAELMEPGLQIFGNPEVLNALVSYHGLIMIFFTLMPALIGGYGNWMVPLMIGASGHGVSPPKQFQLLADAGILCADADLGFSSGCARFERHQRGLDPLCSTVNARDAWTCPGLRHPGASRIQHLFNHRRHQLHHHDLQHARARHDIA